MDEVEYGGGDSQSQSIRAHHIRKRALKNKALSVSFSEKDLKDYVSGFHKRKKKRRKEANQKMAEADRRKRIEARKKRKLEREAVYGGTQPDSSVIPEGSDEDDDETEPIPSVSGTTTYDNGDLKVMVTTREISRDEEEEDAGERQRKEAAALVIGGLEKEKHKIPAIKKVQFKKKAVKVVKKRSGGVKQQKKRDKRKAKVQNKKR